MQENNGNNALMEAITHANIEIALKLLDEDGINVNHANNDGNTALMLALNYKFTEITVKLLEKDSIDVNHTNNFNDTALIFAIIYNDQLVYKLLEREDIVVNYMNEFDFNAPLNIALSLKKVDIVKALVTRLDHEILNTTLDIYMLLSYNEEEEEECINIVRAALMSVSTS